MHEDARHLSELSGDLGIGLLQASMTARHLRRRAVGPLQRLRASTSAGHEFAVPGYMVWAALIYAALGSLLCYWVGGSLIDATPSATRAKPTCAFRWCG